MKVQRTTLSTLWRFPLSDFRGPELPCARRSIVASGVRLRVD